ncbi:MAG: hypothetical protein KAY32_07565 [Candidatus Eisenbacteria sp.]|nr:hypothetical protein [Candidatus Eisenbacteria bacterium]
MRPLFTVHAAEYLVGAYVERTYPRWSVWIPSKDTGIDLLVTGARNRKAVSLQVKFSKDFHRTDGASLLQSRLLATGWWTHDPSKIRQSRADFWVFALPSLVERQTSFIILPPAELLRRFRAIHGRGKTRIHSYLQVTKTKRCWETRGLTKADRELVALDRYSNPDRDFTVFLNAWKQVEKKLK